MFVIENIRGLRVPLTKPRPDVGAFIDTLMGRKVPARPPLAEYLIDNAIMKPVLEMTGRKWVDTGEKEEYMGGQMDLSRESRELINRFLDNVIAFWHAMGYDFVRVEVSLPLPAIAHVTKDTAKVEGQTNRAWQSMTEGVITTWGQFEKYPWPQITDSCFYMHEYVCSHLPEGMGFTSCHAGGVYEHLSRLVSYEGLSMMLYDDPALFKAITDKIGGLLEEYNRRLLQLDGLFAVFQGEDFGHGMGTLISPKAIRDYFLPWHKKYARMAHEAGKLYFLHSCGKMDAVMEDLITDVKIDAKHSFQERVAPVIEWKNRYGDRIGIIGGVDIDVLTTYAPGELRKYVRHIIDECSPGGRFALGSGNSIPSYIPVENYLVMLDEALT
jgi:uroporphyrinogen decarboxylase